MSEQKAALEGTGLRKTFTSGREVRVILDGADVRVSAGEWVAVTGPSGVGKTTLLHLLAGILPPDEGKVFWSGEDLYAMRESDRDRHRAESAGLVFQYHHLLPDLTVEENIRLSLDLARRNGRSSDASAVSRLIEQLGLSDFSSARIDKLSGGERQRVAVARALAHRPKLLFADEPTGNLDERSTAAVLDLFDSARRAFGVSILMSTHNAAVAARATRRLELGGGRVSPISNIG